MATCPGEERSQSMPGIFSRPLIFISFSTELSVPVHQFLFPPPSSSMAFCLSLKAIWTVVKRCQIATDALEQRLLLLFIKVNLPLKLYIEDLLLLILAISIKVF